MLSHLYEMKAKIKLSRLNIKEAKENCKKSKAARNKYDKLPDSIPYPCSTCDNFLLKTKD